MGRGNGDTISDVLDTVEGGALVRTKDVSIDWQRLETIGDGVTEDTSWNGVELDMIEAGAGLDTIGDKAALHTIGDARRSGRSVEYRFEREVLHSCINGGYFHSTNSYVHLFDFLKFKNVIF